MTMSSRVRTRKEKKRDRGGTQVVTKCAHMDIGFLQNCVFSSFEARLDTYAAWLLLGPELFPHILLSYPPLWSLGGLSGNWIGELNPITRDREIKDALIHRLSCVFASCSRVPQGVRNLSLNQWSRIPWDVRVGLGFPLFEYGTRI